ncbi:MAG TPA: helix-turn-helix domain-containing protein [Thermoanaerobaculia bacterium]|nr:helix-turn-helix domain-containing protein [Thermoanaerobaculia bacterium]
MSKKDLNGVRQVFRKAVEVCHLPTRELERALGIGNGNLSRLMDGSLDLRIRHLVAFAELLEVPPTDFLELGCPEAQSKATRRLADLLEPGRPRSTPAALSVSEEKLAEMIREIVEDVLARREGQTRAAKRSRR